MSRSPKRCLAERNRTGSFSIIETERERRGDKNKRKVGGRGGGWSECEGGRQEREREGERGGGREREGGRERKREGERRRERGGK